MSTNDSMRSKPTVVTKGSDLAAYAALFTDEVMQKARRRAEVYAEATKGALTADDLVQRACVTTWEWFVSRRPEIRYPKRILAEAIHGEYVLWAKGWNPEKTTVSGRVALTEKEKHLAGISLTEAVSEEDALPPQLTVGNPVHGWDLEADVRCALQSLSAEEQTRVYRLYWKGDTLQEVGAYDGVTRQWAHAQLQPILKQLRVLLADYAPPVHDEKRSRGTRSPSR